MAIGKIRDLGGGSKPTSDTVKYFVFTTTTSPSLAKIKIQYIVNDEVVQETEYTSANTGTDWKSIHDVQVKYVSQNWYIRSIDIKQLQEDGTTNIYSYGTTMKQWHYGTDVAYLFNELDE